jgi:sugar phosphate isomerase/epimerase
LCYAAKVLGAGSYTFHGPARLKRTPYVLDYDYLGERTQELCDTIKEYGAELAYENVHWAFFNEPPFFIELSKRVPGLKACLDIKQAMQAKVDYIEYIKCMGDRLVNVHVCDYDADGTLKAPGKGTFDFVTFFKVLRDYGYDGPVMTELYSSNYKDYRDLGESIEYLKNCMERARILQ